MIRRPPRSTLFPTRRSSDLLQEHAQDEVDQRLQAYQTTGSPMAEALIAAADEAASQVSKTAAAGGAPAAGAALLGQYNGGVMALGRRHPLTAVPASWGVGVLPAPRPGGTRASQ